MTRPPCLVSLALVCLSAAISPAQTGSQFTTASLLPPESKYDEYSLTGDGTRVYYTSPKGEVMLYDRKTQKTTRISEGGDIWDITVARNGSAVAFTKLGEGNKDEFIWTVPLDPATGLAKAPQRRASMIGGDTPALSHDGRFLAFARDDSAGQSLVVLPTTGGPERTLATFPAGIGTIRWTPDGKTLFFSINPRGQNPAVASTIQRISASGGTPKVVVASPGGYPGLSPDGSLIAVVDSGASRSVAVFDTTGRRLGSLLVPAGFTIGTWTNAATLVASRNQTPFRGHIYSLTNATTRVVADTIQDALWPLWSPNGKELLFSNRDRDFSNLVVMNADGSSGRSIRLERRLGHSMSWSPDGRWNLYATPGLPTTAVAVELGTGKQIPLATADRDIFARWTNDSRAVLVVLGAQSGTSGAMSLRELGLTGESKELLQIPAGLGYHLFPIDRQSAFVRRGADRPMTVESLSGGQKVELVPSSPGFFSGPILSASKQWVAFRRNPQGNDNTRFTVLDIAKMDGSAHMSIEAPFVISPGAAAFLPGDKQLIVAERPGANGKAGVYVVTLATREFKKLFTLQTFKGRFAEVAVSPDGKSILYTSQDSVPAGHATLDVSRVLSKR